MIFVSLPAYTLGKKLGVDQVAPAILKQLDDPEFADVPAVRVLAALRDLDDCQLAIDAGATSIAKARTRHADAFLHMPGADVWVTVDDDVSASRQTMVSLLEAVRSAPRTIVVVPCFLRVPSTIVNVILPPQRAARRLASGTRMVPCVAGGFGMVACSRSALEAMASKYRDLRFVDQDGVERVALFWEPQPTVREGWVGEDFAFCQRAQAAGCSVWALGTGETTHAGYSLDLATFEQERRLG